MPFGEIVANPGDLKHVVELLRCSDGLGVVITVSLHHLCVFYWRLHKCRSGVDRRLVPRWYLRTETVLILIHLEATIDERRKVL